MNKNEMKVRKVVSNAYTNTRLCFLLPTFNREKTIGSALEQISSQIMHSKYREYISVIISENHSTDRSAAIAKNFASQYDFIRVISPKHHLPSGEHNLFFALKKISADFVWSFADDDLLLPGAIDWIYERLSRNTADFILVNSQYQDSNGDILREKILDMYNDVIYFDSFDKIFTEVGPLTLLASFSSAIYRPQNMIALKLDDYLKPSPIYAHVFAYLEAFNKSRIEIWSAPLVVLRRSTATFHWESVAKSFGWYLLYPWTAGLANHILNARKKNLISANHYGFSLNSNENGRYGLIANLLTQFILQLISAIESADPAEIPPPEDFSIIHSVIQGIPYVTVETTDFLCWGERYFADICSLLAPQDSKFKKIPNQLSDAIQSLNVPDMTTAWINKVREKLIERLHAIKSAYVNFGTTSSAPPFVYIQGHKLVIFQLATRFILMSREIYDQDWRAMNPNFLDSAEHSPNWLIFDSFEQTLKRYFELEHEGTAAESELYNDRVLFKIAQTPPWNALLDVIETEDAQSFLEAVSHNSALKNMRQVLGIIYGHSNSINANFNLFLLEPSRQGFINPTWYREIYFTRTQGMERKILQQSPLVHYAMLGARKGWSLSPYFDEFFFLNTANLEPNTSTLLLSDQIGLAKYFMEGCIGEFSPFFSVSSYLEQCKQKGLVIDSSPAIHFLTTGINLGLTPHPAWDEAAYLNVNRDVKLSSAGKPFYGWIHWSMHGRFENRPGAGYFTNWEK